MTTYVTVPGLELGAAGMEWPASTGPFTVTLEDLHDVMVACNDDPHIVAPRVKLGHGVQLAGDQGDFNPFWDGQPAFGKVQNLRLGNDGGVLLGDLVEVPQWLADAMPSAWPSRSCEWLPDVTTEGGKHYRMVITAVALLGPVGPGITNLEDLQRLLDEGPADLPASTSSTTGSISVPDTAVQTSVSVDTIRRRFNFDWAMTPDNGAADENGDALDTYWWWCVDVRLDNDEVIADDDEGNLYAVPFTTDGKDTVNFGQPAKVRQDFVPVAASAAVVTAAQTARHAKTVFASQGTRPVKASTSIPSTSTAALRPADNPDPEEGSMSPEELRTNLGLATDASDEAVAEKYREIMGVELPAPVEETEAEEVEETPVVEVEQPEPELVAASTLTVDRETFETTRQQAARGAELAERTDREQEQAALTSAVREGRIPPSRRGHYETAFKADRDGTLKLLTAAESDGGLAKGLVPVAELGTEGDDTPGVETSADGALPDNVSILTPAERARRIPA